MMQWWDLYVQQPGWLRGIVHFLSIPSCFLAKCLIHKRGSHSQNDAHLWVTSGWSVLEGTLLPLTECPERWEWDVWNVTFCSFSGSYSQLIIIIQIRSDQSLSRVRLFSTLWIAPCQVSLSITNSWSSLRLTSIESVMPSSHLILCRPLLLSPIPLSISLFQWVNSSHEVAKVLEFQL